MNKKRTIPNLTIENAILKFRNFAGKQGNYNPAGRRNFCVLLDEEVAIRLKEENWNIRWLKPTDEYDKPQAYVQVEVNFNVPENTSIQPPKVVLVSSRGKNLLGEDDVKNLDWADIAKADVTIRPRLWDDHGTWRVKAYLKSLWVTIFEDELESKYYDVVDSAAGAIGGCGNCDTCDGSCKDHHK